MANNQPDQTIFEEARSRFLIGLTNSEKDDFKFTTLQGVHDAIDKIQDEHGSQRKMRNMTRIRGFIEAMEQYGTVIEVFLNVSDFIAFIWGPVKFLLLVAKTWAESLDTLLDAYEQLGETVPLLCQYENLFADNKNMRRVLGCIYADILEFHRRALVIFKRKAWKQLFHSTWKNFNAHFRRLLDSLKDNAALIDRQATLIEIETNQLARKTQEKHILETERGELQRQALSVISKLSPADFELDQDNASVNWIKGQSFGLWLLENTKVKAWLDSTDASSNLLWLKGIPGAGKTILTSRLIAVIREMDKHNVVFFYCKDEDKPRNSFAAILKGFISQLLTINPGVLSYLYDECAKSREVTIESITALKSLFTIAADCGEPLWLIVDGLDECEQKEGRKVLNWMLPLLKSGDTPSNLRLLIVSRDEGDIGARLSKVPWITLHDLAAHSNEIRVYTSRKLMKIQKKFQLSKEEAKDLSDRINSRAKGMFLFARLMLKHLKCQTSLTELRAEVNPSQFPDGLDQVYERIVRRIYDYSVASERNAAKAILEWIVCARRSLRWNELQATFSIDLDAETVDFEGRCLRPNNPDNCHSVVKRLCGSLVEISRDNTIHLVHDTAKTYLTGQNNGLSARINVNKSTFDITKTCLRYLSLPAFSRDLEDEQIMDYLSKGYYSFQDYAIAYWLGHFEALVQSIHSLELQSLRTISATFDRFLSMHTGKSSDFFLEHEDHSAEKLHSYLLEQLSCLQLLSKSGSRQSQLSAKTSCIQVLQAQLDRRRSIFEGTIQQVRDDIVMKDNYTLFYGSSAGWYKCPTLKCFGFWEGFSNLSTRQTHTQKHDRAFRCLSKGCPYETLGFATFAELERHRKKNHIIPQEDITFPAPNALVSPEPTESAAQDTSNEWQLQGRTNFGDALRLNNLEDIGNKLGKLKLSTIPSQFKTIGDDWFAINNPTKEQSVAVELLHTFSEEVSILSTSFSHDGTLVALGSAGVVNIFNVTSGIHLCRLSLEPPATRVYRVNYFRSVAFGPTATGLIAAGCEDNLLRVWNFKSKMILHTLAGHSRAIQSIDFASNGLIIASASNDKSVRIWNVEAGSCDGIFNGRGAFFCVAISPDSRLVAAGSGNAAESRNAIIYVWDIRIMSLIHEIHGNRTSVYSLTFSPNSQHLYSTSFDNLVKRWELRGGIAGAWSCVNTMDGALDQCLTVAVTPDDKLLFCGSCDTGVHIYDATTGIIRCLVMGHESSIVSVDVSSISTEREGIFVTGSADKRVRLWKYQIPSIL